MTQQTEQVSVSIMGRTFGIGTPTSEKATLLQAVDMLNQKIEAIQNAPHCRNRQNHHHGRLKRRP